MQNLTGTRGQRVRTGVVDTPWSRGSAVSTRLNATLDSEGSALSTQTYYILVMTTAGAALDKCHNAGVNEGFEAVRDGVGAQASNEVCGTPDECFGVQISRRHSKQAGCVRENRARLREPIDKNRRRRYQGRSDDAGKEDMRVKAYKSARYVRAQRIMCTTQASV